MSSILTRYISILVIAGMFASIFAFMPIATQPVEAESQPQVSIEIGQPSVWSLAQAHYLLARMHNRDRGLRSTFPSEQDLDPNKISATRMDSLRSSFGVEAEFDQTVAVKDSLAMRRLKEADTTRESARANLTARQADLQVINSDLLQLNEQIATLEEEDRQSVEARNRSTPPAPPTAEDNQRKKDLAVLKVRKARKEEERTDVKEQIGTLTTAANTVPSAPTLETPALSSGNGSIPSSDQFTSFMSNALKEAGKPDLSASLKLDNFVQMQYEIISKQLTLLRDEVGPDDRVIFLELPASIYTVDKKADNYVAQTEWEVTRYFDTPPSLEIQRNVILENLRNQGKSDAEIERILPQIACFRPLLIQEAVDKVMKQQQGTYRQNDEEATTRQVSRQFQKRFGDARPYPITLEMIRRSAANANQSKSATTQSSGMTKLNVKAIDIIPRQSALNVNEFHATVKQTMILAAFKFLVGFAGKVSYQRQRELYEQFVQQSVFASGFGKGMNKFGWTYGPQPGTKRISPGQRTTFAVLVVPRNTLAIEIKGRSRYYKRDQSPNDTGTNHVSQDISYLVSVPGQQTQEFWVNRMSYVPARVGKRVTVTVDGDFFSPQLGVLVNGVPLDSVLSIARVSGQTETTTDAAGGIKGEFEITNARQLILSFTMGDSFVGTPIITLVTPEKTTAINFFNLAINYRSEPESLADLSYREPMFIEDFSVGKELDVQQTFEQTEAPLAGAPGGEAGPSQSAHAGNPPGTKPPAKRKFVLARLSGAGLRPSAEIIVNGERLEAETSSAPMADALTAIRNNPFESFAIQDTTRSYLVYFEDSADERVVNYRQSTRQGYETGDFTEKLAQPKFKNSIRHYRFDPSLRSGIVDLTVFSEDDIQTITLVDPKNGRCDSFQKEGKNYRVKCVVPALNQGKIERDFISLAVRFTNNSAKFVDITLPVKGEN